MVKTGRNDPCPCGGGKKYKKCHSSTAVADDHERAKFGAFGSNPLREAAIRRPVKDLEATLKTIRDEKRADTRRLPSASMISIGESPPEATRAFLVDACAKLVEQNWCGRSEMCIYFAVLLRHGLLILGYDAQVEVGRGEYFYRGLPTPFAWDHAWVRTGNDIVDGNVDSLVENPAVPLDVEPRPYWGPAEEIPKDRRLKTTRVLPPERDGIELEAKEIIPWKEELEQLIGKWRTS